MDIRTPVGTEELVPFNDLSIQWRAIESAVRHDLEEVFTTSTFSLGPQVDAFEREVAGWLGSRHAIGVNSGTSALHLAMILSGVGPGVEVLVPAHTFVATAWGVLYAGGTPVLVDVEDETGTIDVVDAARRLSSRTKAIIPVHLYGQPADMSAVKQFANAHGLVIVEDAAQSIGATWGGAMTGTIGAFGCFSFYPGKNLGAAGEAGLILTDDHAMADRLRSLRNHGQRERYLHEEIGFNYRMDGLQAAVLRHKLKLLSRWTEERRGLARCYSEAFNGLPLRLPRVVLGDHVWHLYVIRTPQRDALRAHLASRRIETGLHYPVPLHRQRCFAGLAIDPNGYKIADHWAEECLSLPLFVGMTAEQQKRVIAAVTEFFIDG